MKKKLLLRLRVCLRARLRASFTIEAAVIVPITMLIVVWLINASISVHGRVVDKSNSISLVLSAFPTDNPPEAPAAAVSMNTGNLDGRKVLLKYKLLKDGVRTITGGLLAENEPDE
ncbi:MAG: hypothetical protein ACOX75_05870 [Lachnospiraceae bacterium]|jgi:hypothetical protein